MAVRASKIAVAVPIGRPHLRGGGSGVLDSRVSQGLTAKRAPLLTDLRAWPEKTQSHISGKSDLAGAIRYTLTRWNALTLVLRDGRLGRQQRWRTRNEADDLGRENWLFAGSDAGETGPRRSFR